MIANPPGRLAEDRHNHPLGVPTDLQSPAISPVRRSDGFAIRRQKMSQPLYALGICNPQQSVMPCKSNPLLKKH